MASKDQRLKKCKTFPAGYVCLSLLCVHPRFCKISKQARREIQYLSRDFPSPRAKSGVSSEGSCSRRGNTNLRFFFFPLSSLAVSPLRETVPAQCFLMIPLRRHYKRLTGSKSFPSCSKTFCGPAALASDCALGGLVAGSHAAPTFPWGLEEPRSGRMRARGRAGLVGKSVEAAECCWQSVLEPSKTLQNPCASQKINRISERREASSSKVRVSNSPGSFWS